MQIQETIFVLCTGLITLLRLSLCANECEVKFQDGTVLGAITETLNPSKNVCSYLGIPYGRPPLGALRFKPPQIAEQLKGTLNATKYPNWCPQEVEDDTIISEDCLYLNIFQPKTVNSDLPVMIWVHGGGFIMGSSDEFNPKRLLARGDVILVVPHYRLGALGFLSTGDLESPGNYGLKDISLAIHWVKENIHYFGGNSSQITIFGHSAGAEAVMLQFLSPLNTGILNGVIAQSGTALGSWAIDRSPLEGFKSFSKKLNCSSEHSSSEEMLSCLREVPWKDIVKAQSELGSEIYREFKYPYAVVTPVIEPYHEGAFLSEEPLEIMKNGNIPNIPVMFGATKHDAGFMLGQLYLNVLGPNGLDKNGDYLRNELVPDLLKFMEIKEDISSRGVSSSVEMTYLEGRNRSSWNDSMPGLVDLMTVFWYKSALMNQAELLSKRGLRVYLYSFEYPGNHSLFWDMLFGNRPVPIEKGIAHGEDILYLFDYPISYSSVDEDFSGILCDLWVNFAQFGNPTPPYAFSRISWPPYNNVDEQYMEINKNLRVQSNYRSSWRPNRCK